jgi:hypothetical protein
VPKKSFNILKSDTKLIDEDNLFDNEPYWKYEPILKTYFEEIGEILQEGISWSKDIKQYGSIESNCLEVLFDDQTNNVESVSLRIDFTTEFEGVLRSIIDFCIYKELILLDEELKVVSLNYESINSIINNSSQLRRYNELRG